MSTYHPAMREQVIKNRAKETATWEPAVQSVDAPGFYATAYRPMIRDAVSGDVIWMTKDAISAAGRAWEFAESALKEYHAGTLDLIRYDARVGDLG